MDLAEPLFICWTLIWFNYVLLGKTIIGEGNGEISSPVEASIPVQVLGTKQEGIGEGNGGTSSPVEASIPVQVLDTKKEGAPDTKKEGENNFVAFFARIFEKCCEPFNKKKDWDIVLDHVSAYLLAESGCNAWQQTQNVVCNMLPLSINLVPNLNFFFLFTPYMFETLWVHFDNGFWSHEKK